MIPIGNADAIVSAPRSRDGTCQQAPLEPRQTDLRRSSQHWLQQEFEGTSMARCRSSSEHDGSATLPHLIHVLPSFGIGGQQIRLAQLVNRLRGRYRHTIVPLDGTTTARALVEKTENFAVELWTAPK